MFDKYLKDLTTPQELPVKEFRIDGKKVLIKLHPSFNKLIIENSIFETKY